LISEGFGQDRGDFGAGATRVSKGPGGSDGMCVHQGGQIGVQWCWSQIDSSSIYELELVQMIERYAYGRPFNYVHGKGARPALLHAHGRNPRKALEISLNCWRADTHQRGVTIEPSCGNNCGGILVACAKNFDVVHTKIRLVQEHESARDQNRRRQTSSNANF
jgi:hypothetical protein